MVKKILASLSMIALATSLLVATPATVYAEPKPDAGNRQGLTANCTDANNVCVSGLPRTSTGAGWVRNILNVVIGIIAAISLLFVVIGGMRYVFSQGDPQGVSKAKSTIIYALIGLVVALMAQGLVALVVKVVL